MWVRVVAGGFSAYGLWDTESQIAARLYSRRQPPDAEWVKARVLQAWSLREPLLTGSTNAFRLLYGEGDGLPGVVVDYYAGYCALVHYSASLEPLLKPIADAVLELGPVRGVFRREASGTGLEVLAGAAPPNEVVVMESGIRLKVNLAAGQKTGLFLDHRDNRSFVARHARDRSVLNLFCYTGAFSLAALAGGARHVTSVDSAGPSLQAARDNFVYNGYDPSCFEFVQQDAFEYLSEVRASRRQFDMVVSDPPSFAKRREQLRVALKAYRKLSVAGIRVTAPGGLYVAASCTSQVSPEQFRQVLAEAAERANRRLQIIHEAGHAIDHPVLVAHPEGRYLKFVVARVLAPC